MPSPFAANSWAHASDAEQGQGSSILSLVMWGVAQVVQQLQMLVKGAPRNIQDPQSHFSSLSPSLPSPFIHSLQLHLAPLPFLCLLHLPSRLYVHASVHRMCSCSIMLALLVCMGRARSSGISCVVGPAPGSSASPALAFASPHDEILRLRASTSWGVFQRRACWHPWASVALSALREAL